MIHERYLLSVVALDLAWSLLPVTKNTSQTGVYLFGFNLPAGRPTIKSYNAVHHLSWTHCHDLSVAINKSRPLHKYPRTIVMLSLELASQSPVHNCVVLSLIMKLSICLTVALTALSVAAAPSLSSPVHLQERGKFGAVASLVKAGSKVKIPHHVRLPPKRPHGRPAPHRPSPKPSHPAPHRPPPGHRPPVRLPPQKPKSRPAPPPPPPSNSDPFSGLDGMFNDAASQNEPHFNLGSILRRNRDYDQW
ncbi:hypothetical protein M378DRAFT_292776 [Amanita muscaria Koide BX008]|uniref:Uncharacterized protein n=1 Tax=Amanita muscaria (strain Koide BX008) TaxID=946122 RepID=A0A0C2WQ09_AMAMK|nr:hypothetical protein M378DRAFT_292776 [Amanita muscaria Koide BX008]